MKLFCISSFHNSPALKITVDPTHPAFKAPNHIPRGYRFSIGSGDDFPSLLPDERALVGTLVKAKRVMFDDTANAGKIKIIESEIAKELAVEKKEKSARETAQASTVAAVLASLPDLIASAVQAAVAAKK